MGEYMAYSKEVLSQALDSIKEASLSKDKNLSEKAILDFYEIYSQDPATYLFNDSKLLKEFYDFVIGYYLEHPIVLTSKTISILNELPEEVESKILTNADLGNDDDLLRKYVNLLERDKKYSSLIVIAGKDQRYFKEIENEIIKQRKDMSYILDFLQKFPEKADVHRIMRNSIDYQFFSQRASSNPRKCQHIKSINDKIYELGKSIIEKNKNEQSQTR